jgi:uncharacterized repeat protein (TIGR01451 family)
VVKPKVKKRPAPKRAALKPSPILVVDKVASRRMLPFGQTVDFVITVRNRGRGDATNVTVCDRLPDGLVFMRARGARLVGGDACWRMARLRAGRKEAFTVRTAATRTERRLVIVNVVTVAGASSCQPRIKLAASRAGEVCAARAAVVVMPARHNGRGGGVTG